MPLKVDIHMHTTFSDGLKTPSELIEYAKSRNVDIMCINDHDTVKGVIDMLKLDITGITVLCGIELSTKWNQIGSIHIAGYFPRDTDFEALQKELDQVIRRKR